VFGVVGVWDHRDDAGDVFPVGCRWQGNDGQRRVPREVAAAADDVEHLRPGHVRRVDVSVEVDLQRAVDGHDAEAIDERGTVGDVGWAEDDVLGVTLGVLELR